MPTYIYSQRYPIESFLPESDPIVLDFHRRANFTLSDEEFIKKAIFLSKEEQISLDILKENEKLSADFTSRTLVFSSESTHLLEELISSCSIVEVIASRRYPYAVTIRLGRINTK